MRASGPSILLVLLLLAGCGGGAGAPAAPSPAQAPAPPSSVVVVRYDHTGDGALDVLTLDASTSPFQVVEGLEGTADGGAVDRTAAWRGDPVDPALTEALARHLGSSYEIGVETDLEVVLGGRTVTVTVME